MMISKMAWGRVLTTAAAALLAAAPVLAADREVDQTVKADKDGVVTIENVAGSVRVEGWDKGEVRITGTLGEDVEDLQVKEGGRTTVIKVIYPKRMRSIDEGADLMVMVPRGAGVETECVSASVDVDGVAGALELSTISGEVTVKGKCLKVNAETISGDLLVECDAPAISAQSISGRVTVRSDRSAVEAQTVSGDIRLTCQTFQELAVESVSGSVTVAGAFAKAGRFTVDLHSGDAILDLAGEVDADFAIETFSGDIDNAFGAKASSASKYAPGKTLEFTAGDGGARVRINTFSGDVKIRRP